jgi:hypothetical protein
LVNDGSSDKEEEDHTRKEKEKKGKEKKGKEKKRRNLVENQLGVLRQLTTLLIS